MTFSRVADLAEVRRRLAVGDPALQPALDKLRAEADAALTQGPWSVMDKKLTASSGDKHDYLSLGVYWWPNPATPDGMPYVWRDGQVNPDHYEGTDGASLRAMLAAVETLSLAAAFTENDAYGDRAALLLRTWFLDDATRMTPHLRFAQGIPGVCEGRGLGIIDTQALADLPISLFLLRGAAAWSAADEGAVRDWLAQYLEWLTTSENGQQESNEPNNHATWYDVQVVSLALYTGQEALAARVLGEVAARRIVPHTLPDGRQAGELKRTRGFTYSVFNLYGLFQLAALGETVGIDLWHYRSDDGRSLRGALDFLAPYADPVAAWPYQEIGDAAPFRARLWEMLRQAAFVYGEPAYAAALPAEAADDRVQLLYARV